MPELPDVELFRRVLAKRALRKPIASVSVSDARILGRLSAGRLRQSLLGRRLVGTRRHGKHLLAKIEGDGWLTLHFGMSGGLEFFANDRERPPYARVCLGLTDDGSLAYTNKRMIGRVGLADDAKQFIADEQLGPDALDRRFTFSVFAKAVAGVRRDVKSALMDQGIVAGIGNVYADEILFQARIHPKTRIDRLDRSRLERLYRALRAVLKTAIAHRAGAERFTDRMPRTALLPARQKGGLCPRCKRSLETVRIGGRTSYFCPSCQS